MATKIGISEIVGLMIGFFVLFLVVEALYGTVNDAVNDLNTTMHTEGYETAGTLVVRGWQVFQYVIGLGALILAGAVIVKKAKSL